MSPDDAVGPEMFENDQGHSDDLIEPMDPVAHRLSAVGDRVMSEVSVLPDGTTSPGVEYTSGCLWPDLAHGVCAAVGSRSALLLLT
jgi:hypothetical protein